MSGRDTAALKITLWFREGESAGLREEARGRHKHSRNTTSYVQEARESRDVGAGGNKLRDAWDIQVSALNTVVYSYHQNLQLPAILQYPQQKQI